MREYERAMNNVLIDGLTGLYNHSHLQEELRREVERSRRYERPLTLVIVDVDHFEQYNERHGYLAGDRALITLATLLRSLIRGVDIIARFGGEEFAIILPETELDGALEVGERIRLAIQAYPIPHREQQPTGAFTVSVGVVSLSPLMATARDLIAAGQVALGVAKDQGGNRLIQASERSDSTTPAQ